MATSLTDQDVKNHMKAARKLRKELNTQEKIRDFLIRAGIAERCKSAPNGVRLAKHYR